MLNAQTSKLVVAGMGSVGMASACAVKMLPIQKELVMRSRGEFRAGPWVDAKLRIERVLKSRIQSLKYDDFDAKAVAGYMGASKIFPSSEMEISVPFSSIISPGSNHTEKVWSNDPASLRESRIVMITAGMARKPGMERKDLLLANMKIMSDIHGQMPQELKDDPKVVWMITTNPLDVMVRYWSLLLDDKRIVVGLNGVLDGGRAAGPISFATGVPVRRIMPCALGEHGTGIAIAPEATLVGDNTLMDLLRKGILSSEAFEGIKKATKFRGTEIVNALGKSAYIAPGIGVARMAYNILSGNQEIFYASTLLRGDFGQEGICMGVPVQFSNNSLGIIDISGILDPDTTMKDLNKGIASIRQDTEIMLELHRKEPAFARQ
ncbi:Malate dehydrogenase [uncultured archaeon]|nr:Malate dehydrogenase [uncultured archaeon]